MQVHSASSVQLTVDLLVTKYLKFIDVRYILVTQNYLIII